MTAKRKKRGPKPLPPDEGKRLPLNMRTTKEVRASIERAAKESGRSLAQEVEYRIGKSLQDEDRRYSDFGGEDAYRVCLLLPQIGAVIEAVSGGNEGRSWTKDPATLTATIRSWVDLMRGTLEDSAGKHRGNYALFDAMTIWQPDEPGEAEGAKLGRALLRLHEKTKLPIQELLDTVLDAVREEEAVRMRGTDDLVKEAVRTARGR